MIEPAAGLRSIKQERRVGATLVRVDAVSVTAQRDHGSTGGEREDEGQGCDVGLHGWFP